MYIYVISHFVMQIKLLKILALLGGGDKQASEQMYTVVGDIMRKCDSTSNIGNAVLYECISCVSSILPNPKLLEAAADAISKFLKVWFPQLVCFVWPFSFVIDSFSCMCWPE